ncbi:unnamed protein product [marine sediment metagenome]|uniref:Uncharacterized protein n=1 Tax=marine sediment metagenome TaxID=412755 RepID=X0SJ52_9ZZZZ
MAPGGRPTLLTLEVQEQIVRVIQAGNYREVAAQHAGIGERTLVTWMAKGKEEEEGIHYEFRRAVLKAEHDAEIAMVVRVRQAAAEDAKHAQWWLERKFRQRWGREKTVKHSGDPDNPLQVDHNVNISIERAEEQAPEVCAILDEVGAFDEGEDGEGEATGDAEADEVDTTSADS